MASCGEPSDKGDKQSYCPPKKALIVMANSVP